MQKVLRLIIFGGILFSFCSCELETSGNGKLDGYWHLEAVDTLGRNGVSDLSNKRLFWSFQNKLLELRDRDGMISGFLFRFEHRSDSLILTNPYLYNREEGDKPLTDAAQMAPYGLNELTERLKIETLKGEKMVLSNKKYRLRLVRF